MSLNPTISLVNAAHETATHDAPVRDLLQGIANGRWATEVELVREAYDFGGKDGAASSKRSLPAILFSGTFSRRAASALVAHSGLICADLDDLGNAVASTKEQISADPHVLAAFVSPTGSGLKVVFRCDPTKPHAESFHALEHYVAEHFGLRIDQKCSDVSRMCFVSHDPELFEAEDAACLPYPPPAPEKTFTPKQATPGAALSPGDDYNARGADEIPTLLESHGWTHSHGKYWIRPGKTNGISASWQHYPNTLHIFSDSPETGFPSDQKGFDPFAIYTHLEHHGDWRAATKALGARGYGQPTKSRQQQNLERVTGTDPDAPAQQPLAGRAPSSYALPSANDPSILIGNRWLSRGDIAILASTSGMGKSSLALQAAYHWALGLKLFGGFAPNGCLKTLIVQAEDGDGDIAEVRLSLEHAMKLNGSQKSEIDRNIVIVTDRVNRGTRFRAALKSLLAQHKPDIVIINPLLAFMDGDVNSAQDVGKFIREELNSLNEPATFAYIVVHHASKPPKERTERRWNEMMYEMAGSADLTNAARAILSLQAGDTKGEFKLRAAKRGMRAGLTEPKPGTVNPEIKFDTPTDEISIRHSKDRFTVNGQDLPVIHWERFDAGPPPEKAKTGRPAADVTQFFRFVPTTAETALPANEIWRLSNGATGMSNRGFAKMLFRSSTDGSGVSLIDKPGRGPCYYVSV